ncbi:MAG: six-hairpin glycosidase [Saprospirales bacterium]|nr:six-hairpin glycosidase [Saprospirales bacterium]
MKILLLCLLPFFAFGQKSILIRDIKPLPFTDVKVKDKFWAPRIETVCKTTIPFALRQCEETGRIRNFELASRDAGTDSGNENGAFCSAYPFDDSDVYKIIEGAAYALQHQYDASLDAQLDSLIGKIAAAQEPDGYLYSWRSIYEKYPDSRSDDKSKGKGLRMAGTERWQLTDQHSHELYNLGHLYEAAVAHHLATGKRNLLDVALKSADLVCNTFGPGKLEKVPGHEEIEIGLVKLYQLTGEQRYLDMASFFLEKRGYGEEYSQNHLPVREQREVKGHAVRACYLYSAMADVASLTKDTGYVEALNALWEDVIRGKVYFTGGIGSSQSNEGFTDAYDLPNFSAYAETCASIGFVLWNQRMFQLTGDAKYIDVLERTLYNALNSGLGFSGDRFFYDNPLASLRNHERSEWFACACCPSNIARFFPSLPGYIYAKWGNTVYVNLFAESETTVENVNSRLQIVPVTLRQKTNYPWDGEVNIIVEPEKPNTFELRVRIPGWARGDAFPGDLYSFSNKSAERVYFSLNGKDFTPEIRNGYAIINRKWKKNDLLSMRLPMDIYFAKSHSAVAANVGRKAIQRGPLVYCVEGKDQEFPAIHYTWTDFTKPVSTRFEPNFLNGVQTLSLAATLLQEPHGNRPTRKPLWLKAIPYYAWANRGADNMAVWLADNPASAKKKPAPNLIEKARITVPEGSRGKSSFLNDRWIPNNSADLESTYVRFPVQDTVEILIELPEVKKISEVHAWWFTGKDCKLPASWSVQFHSENGWVSPIHGPDNPTLADGWSECHFDEVETRRIRLLIVGQHRAPTGLHELRVVEEL